MNRNEYQKEYRKRKPEVQRNAQRKWRLRAKYDMTIEEYEDMRDRQGGVCAICEQPQEGKWLAVDHNHNTSEVRGLLCENCNRGLGKFKDDPDLIYKAWEYLDANQS